VDDGDSGGENEEDVLDIGNGIDGGDTGSSVGDEEDELEETEEDVEEDIEDDVEEDNPIVGNGFMEEVAQELEGSRTR
jgi:hypothetical protein